MIEMQNSPQPFFTDRILYYLSFIFQKQAKRGEWDYEMNPIYSINILDFKITADNTRYISHVQLMDVKRKTTFYDKLSLFFIELPKVIKEENKLQTNEEWWCHLLKHISEYREIPEQLKENEIFKRLFEEAAVANMTPEEYELYVESLKRKNMFNKPQDFIDAYDRALKKSQNKVSTLTDKVSTLTNQNTTLTSQNTTMSSQISTLSSQNTTLSRDNAAKDAKIAQLEQRLKQQAGLS
jgi:predicted transposase/invertase (TIGR01784 family)